MGYFNCNLQGLLFALGFPAKQSLGLTLRSGCAWRRVSCNQLGAAQQESRKQHSRKPGAADMLLLEAGQRVGAVAQQWLDKSPPVVQRGGGVSERGLVGHTRLLGKVGRSIRSRNLRQKSLFSIRLSITLDSNKLEIANSAQKFTGVLRRFICCCEN